MKIRTHSSGLLVFIFSAVLLAAVDDILALAQTTVPAPTDDRLGNAGTSQRSTNERSAGHKVDPGVDPYYPLYVF